MNPLSVITGATSGRILGDPDVRALCLAMMRELAEIGEAIGIVMPISAKARIAETQALGDFKTSMLQDFEAGRSLEIDPILGVVADLAGHLGIATPAISSVLGLVRVRTTRPGPA